MFKKIIIYYLAYCMHVNLHSFVLRWVFHCDYPSFFNSSISWFLFAAVIDCAEGNSSLWFCLQRGPNLVFSNVIELLINSSPSVHFGYSGGCLFLFLTVDLVQFV